MHTYIYIYVYIYIYISMHVYMYTHTHTHIYIHILRIMHHDPHWFHITEIISTKARSSSASCSGSCDCSEITHKYEVSYTICIHFKINTYHKHTIYSHVIINIYIHIYILITLYTYLLYIHTTVSTLNTYLKSDSI